jgi:hypothetical protein
MAMKRCIIIRLQLISAGALALAACATTGSPPVQTRIQYVDRPVATQPIKPEDKPAVPAPLGPRPPAIRQAADLLLSKVCEWVAYGVRADPLLSVSAGQKPGELAKYPECEKR